MNESSPSGVRGRSLPLRVLKALLAAIGLAMATLFVWMLSAAGAASVIPEKGLLLVGYSQIALIPISLAVGGLTGFVLSVAGWLNRAKRWLIAIAACGLIGVAINGAMAFLVSGV